MKRLFPAVVVLVLALVALLVRWSAPPRVAPDARAVSPAPIHRSIERGVVDCAVTGTGTGVGKTIATVLGSPAPSTAEDRYRLGRHGHQVALYLRRTGEPAEALRLAEAMAIGSGEGALGLGGLLRDVGLVLAPMLAAFVVVAAASCLIQVGLLWAPAKIKPEWGKISPLKGFTRMFSAA